MKVIGPIKKKIISRFKDSLKDYQNHPITIFLLENGVDIRNKLEYFFGLYHLKSFTISALLFNDSKIFEIMIKNVEKFNPKDELERLGKNTYWLAKFFGRTKMIKILEKYGIKSDDLKITKKQKDNMFTNFENTICSLENIKKFKNKNIDVIDNIDLIKACFMVNDVFDGILLYGDQKIIENIMDNRDYFDIPKYKVVSDIARELVKNTKNKNLIALFEKERKAVNKLPFFERVDILLKNDKHKELIVLIGEKLDIDKPAPESGRFMKAMALHHMGKHQEVIKILKKRLEHDPKDPDALRMMTGSLSNLGDLVQVLKYADKQIDIHKKANSLELQTSYTSKARILDMMGDYLGALKYWKKANGKFDYKNKRTKEGLKSNKENIKEHIEHLKLKIKGSSNK